MASAVVLTACSRDEGDLFNDSAAERVKKAQEKLYHTLVDEPNGWEMRYFPHSETAGYAFLMQFYDDKSVLIATKNKVSSSSSYKEEVSLWGTDGTQGAVLTFNSYNSIFHKFADPGTDGLGYEGDYEFVVMQTTPECIKLKGKKHGAYIYMYPLSDEYATDWAKYFADVDQINELVFDGNEGVDMTYLCDGQDLQLIYDKDVFNYSVEGEQFERGFIITPSGLHFYSGLPTAGADEAADFVVAADMSCLYDAKHEAVILSNYDAAEFFKKKFENKARWIYSDLDTDAATTAAVDALRSTLLSKGAVLSRIGYERYQKTASSGLVTYSYDLYVGYTVENVFKEGKINLNYTNSNGVITFSFKGVDTSDKPLAELLARLDTDATKAAKMLAAPFLGTFTPESYTGSKLNMTQITLRDGDRYIHVVADNKLY